MALLVAQNLTKKFKNKTAVNRLNFKLDAGELIAFLGPNGAGKSTTINMLTGITKPTAGTVLFQGAPLDPKTYHHEIGIVFQNSVLDDDLSVQDNLKLRAKLYQKLDLHFINHLIKLFGINLIMHQKYKTLSGGQKRRVDIARALLHQPKLLFLDELSTGLDLQTRNKIWATLNQLRKAYGITILLTTHYLEEAENADYIYIIDRGQIKAAGDVQTLKLKYTRSHLTLWSNQMKQLQQAIQTAYRMVQTNQMEIEVSSDQQALTLLNQVQPLIQNFEYRHVSMDDLFIKLTGKEIR